MHALARILAGARQDLRREQVHDDSVLVGTPDRAVAAQEGRARALFAPEPERSVEQPVDEPLEADRHFPQLAAQLARHAVDQAAGHERLAHRRTRAPARSVAEQIFNGCCQVVIGVEQPLAGRHDAVAIGIGVVAEREVVLVFQGHERRHRVRRRAVHPDLAVVIERHESEGGIDLPVHDREVQSELGGDRIPVIEIRPAERIDAEPQAASRRKIDHVDQIANVRRDEVVLLQLRIDTPRPLHVLQQIVRALLDPARRRRVRRPAVGRVVLDAAVLGRIVRRGDDDPVGEVFGATAIGGEDRVGDRRCWGVAVGGVHSDVDLVCGKHLERGAKGR